MNSIFYFLSFFVIVIMVIKMKKYILACLASTLLLSSLVGCNDEKDPSTDNSDLPELELESSPIDTSSDIDTSVSNEESDVTSNSSEEELPPDNELNYRLEDGETYNPFKISFDEVKSLPKANMSIEGISNLVVDPFQTSYFGEEATVRYPTAEFLSGKTILYTSAWYSRNTIKRSDDVIEYVLFKDYDMNAWYVDSISTTSETFIPFNGAVLSIPKSEAVSFYEFDIINIKNDSIPKYDLGLYNQDGIRLAVQTANSVTFNETGINLYDNNVLGEVTRSAWVKTASINCYYDSESQSYVVDKFRIHNKNGKIYTNVNDGFMLASAIKSNRENVAIFEGVRFNDGDKLKVEQYSGVHEKVFEFQNNSVNTHKTSNGKTVSFNLSKSNSFLTTNRYGWEVAVSKNNVIIDHGAQVDLPDGGYKLIITSAGETTGEQVNIIFEECFSRGSTVNLSGTTFFINSATQVRKKNFYNIVNTYLQDTLTELSTYNYSYNIDALNNSQTKLDNIKAEMDSINNQDPTLEYRLYTLLGSLNQIYYDIISATNRNEAAQVKSSWYINSYTDEDKNLDSLIKNLRNIKNSGINELIVGVIDDGRVNYPDSDIFDMIISVQSKNYGEYGNNHLNALITEAHKLGMKVFANFTPFTNGLENAFDTLKDAQALSINGSTSVVSSQGKVEMLDPANSKVKEAIIATVNDILTKNPDLDGLHLDYIRFGADNNYINTVMGVTDAARVGFTEWAANNNLSYSFDTLDALRNGLKTPSVFSSFNSYQQDLITDTVRYIKEECKKYDKPLTAAIADDYDYTKTWKCQDWGEWAKLGYVDALYLMDYYFDEFFINKYFEDMVKNTGNTTMLVTGIDPSYANLADEYYARTIKGGVKNEDSHGYGIFGTHTQNAKKDGWDLIKDSNWIDSLSVYDDLAKTMKASGDLLLDRCDNIYIHYSNQTSDQKALLEEDLNALYALINQEKLFQDNKKLILCLLHPE